MIDNYSNYRVNQASRDVFNLKQTLPCNTISLTLIRNGDGLSTSSPNQER